MSNEPDVTTVCPKCMSVNVQRYGLQSIGQPDQISAAVMGQCLDCGHVYDTAYGKEVLRPNTFHIENEDGEEVEVSKEEFMETMDSEPEAAITKLACTHCKNSEFEVEIGEHVVALCPGCNDIVLDIPIPDSSDPEKLTCADCTSEKFAIKIRGYELRAICCGCDQVVLEMTMPATETNQ